jgi:hypothetical protein
VEDREGRRYAPCAAPLTAHAMPDALDPGESFRVVEPFRLPAAASPAGVVVHHGAFPGVLIIGDAQSLLHRPALMEVVAGPKRGPGGDRGAGGTALLRTGRTR